MCLSPQCVLQPPGGRDANEALKANVVLTPARVTP